MEVLEVNFQQALFPLLPLASIILGSLIGVGLARNVNLHKRCSRQTEINFELDVVF